MQSKIIGVWTLIAFGTSLSFAGSRKRGPDFVHSGRSGGRCASRRGRAT